MSINEIRLGPISSEYDLGLATSELADKENEIIRLLNEVEGRTVEWDEITDKPLVFPPDLTLLPAVPSLELTWALIEGKPSDLAGFGLLTEAVGLITSRIDEHEQEINPHPQYGRLSQSNTWEEIQIFQSATVPFEVIGADQVDNLNANFLQGNDASYFRAADNTEFTGLGDLSVDGIQLIGGQIDLTGSFYPYLFLDGSALMIPNLDADKVDGYHASGLGRLDQPNTWSDSQIFSDVASFQGPSIPFVVVGSDRVDNLNAELWDDLGRGTTGQVVLAVTGGASVYGQIDNSHILGAAGIAWSKISKVGSSLADLATRSAGDLSSGNLARARHDSLTAFRDDSTAFSAFQTFAGGLQVTGGSSGNGRFWNDATNGLSIRGVAGVTNCLDMRNNAGQSVLTVANGTQTINFPGNIGVGAHLTVASSLTVTGFSTASVATAGAATLPSNPVGFLIVSINGTSRKIPFYAT